MRIDGQFSATGQLLAQFADGDDGECLRIGDVLERYRRRAFGVFLLAATVPNLIGISIVSGVVVALVGVQILVHLERLWLPGWLRRRELKREHLRWLPERLRKPLLWLAKLARPRVESLCDSSRTSRSAAFCCSNASP